MLAPLDLVALLLAPSPMQRAVNALTDDTFSGIHQLSWFDWSLLIPYFTVMVVLSIYGLHRYEMIRGYLKHRRKLQAEPSQRRPHRPLGWLCLACPRLWPYRLCNQYCHRWG